MRQRICRHSCHPTHAKPSMRPDRFECFKYTQFNPDCFNFY
ncbi:hypothetical protein BCEN4_860011 [Burkholderia cenocepacia]|nr:hypothetical protein BCEN4_860011 [Burkholderia cenocepacia]